MRLARLLLPVSIAFLIMGAAEADASADNDAVLVIGALHDLHEREPAFGYDELRRAILAFAPDILVLEVRPDELAGRTATAGRPEYPAVIWPLLADMRVKAIGMEPDGETFKAITEKAGAALDMFRHRNAEGAAALSRFDEATRELLLVHWQSAGQVQDQTTASLTAGVRAAQFALAGPAFADAQSRWDAYMSGRVVDAVRANPGKKVMVIGSYKNRALLEQAVRASSPQRVMESPGWFERVK